MAQQKGRTSKADATRRQLLDAAIEVISERGYADTTVERIVEVAGVSKGVAYYHFSSKADIATCILVEGIGEIVDDFVAIAGKAPSAVEALTAMMDSFAATIFRNAGFGRILVSELWRRGREWSEPMRAFGGAPAGGAAHGGACGGGTGPEHQREYSPSFHWSHPPHRQ